MFLLDGTEYAQAYADAEPLWEEQWKKRDPTDSMTCPFWSNYWYEPCQSCDCRIDKSVSMEIDAMFFLRNSVGKTMALHIEMKRDRLCRSGKQRPIGRGPHASGISAVYEKPF